MQIECLWSYQMLWNHGAGEEDGTERVSVSERREQGGREERQHEPNRQGKAWEVDGKTVARKLTENWIPPYLCDPEVYGLFLRNTADTTHPIQRWLPRLCHLECHFALSDTQKVSSTHP